MEAKLNKMHLVIGLPGSGKTTVMRRLLVDHLTKYPTGIAIVHDTQMEFRDLCRSYESADAYRAAARDAMRSRKHLSRGIAITGIDSAQVTKLAIELGKLHNVGRDSVRVPIYMAEDETSTMTKTQATFVEGDDWEVIVTRRHLGIVLALNLQDSTALPGKVYRQATDAFITRLPTEEVARDLEGKLALPKGTLQEMLAPPLGQCQPFRFAHWQTGKGLL